MHVHGFYQHCWTFDICSMIVTLDTVIVVDTVDYLFKVILNPFRNFSVNKFYSTLIINFYEIRIHYLTISNHLRMEFKRSSMIFKFSENLSVFSLY